MEILDRLFGHSNFFLADESDMDLFRGYIGKGRISLYIELVFLSNLMKNHLEQWVRTTKKK